LTAFLSWLFIFVFLVRLFVGFVRWHFEREDKFLFMMVDKISNLVGCALKELIKQKTVPVMACQ